MDEPGRHVAFLGMDGIGKSSLARLLERERAARGIPVRRVSWRDQMHADTRPNVATALRELWVESWRLIYLGHDAGPPTTYERFEREGWERRLTGLDLPANMPAGLLAAVYNDLAGQALVHYEAVRPLCAEGTWVIEESFGLKLVLKQLLTARALGGQGPVQDEVRATLGRLADLYEPRMPDIGIVVSGPVALAYQWRIRQTGETKSMEDLGAAGRKGRAGFESLQAESDRFFRDLASTRGWLLFEMQDAPAEHNFARLLAELRRHPAWAH